MKVEKAVITAAGRGARLYPAADTVQKVLVPVVDRDGVARPVLQIIAEEALAAGVEELCVVGAPGDEARCREGLARLAATLGEAFPGEEWARAQAGRLEDLQGRLSFAVQEEPRGYGHAVYQARGFAAGAPFLLLLGDHLYLSEQEGKRCAEQVVELAVREACAVSAVNPTREHLIGRYGTLSGRREPRMPGVYRIERIREKPALSMAELELMTPGLRAGHYLCFFGMHVLTPRIFELLEQENGREGELQLTPALQELARCERHLALEVRGTRYDIGESFGLLRAQVALGLAGSRRDELTAVLLETLAEDRGRGR